LADGAGGWKQLIYEVAVTDERQQAEKLAAYWRSQGIDPDNLPI